MRTGSKDERRVRGRTEDAFCRSFRAEAEGYAAIRELRLARRRSRIPWIYSVYQARRKGRGQALADRSSVPPSALPTQECRHVQRRLDFEVPEIFVRFYA